jgi:Fic family protein
MKKENIFSLDDFNMAETILGSPLAKLSDLSSAEIKDLAVVWCYYSGKIEGNTYTYVETEALLKDGITSEKRYEDAKMLKNLYNTFISEVEYINKQQNTEVIDERSLFRIHQSISSGLVSGEESGNLRNRAVRISGTDYIPPKNIADIRSKLNEILFDQSLYENPLEKAVYLHCNIAKLQPFIDGNKRTARMVESITMMNADIIPVYSSKEADILNYRRGLIEFYETGNYSKYVEYFLDKQIDRINEMGD